MLAVASALRGNMQTIFHSGIPGTRERVIAAYGGGKIIGWKLRGNAGVVFNLAYANEDHLSVVPNVASVLNAIGGDSILVHGNAGISITAGVCQSTHQDQDSDCLIEQILIGDVHFTAKAVVG